MDDVLIIGAGPAGLAAALQLKRYGLTLRLFEKSRPGGLLWNANWVENYPGFPGGISGPDLVGTILKHTREIEVTAEPVIELSWDGNYFYAQTSRSAYQAGAAIIASGTKPRTLAGFAIPEQFHDQIVYEVVDLLDVVAKRIIIVGSGDAAFDYGLNLARKNSVIILNRGEQVKCLPLLWDRAQACPNLDYHPSTAITMLTDRQQGGMIVECSSPQGKVDFQADYLVGAIGREAQLDFVSETLKKQSAELGKMGILHFVGDVKNGIFRQTAIAVGDGIRAGMQIHQVVKENVHESDCFDG
jgi:thioredoxin reductase